MRYVTMRLIIDTLLVGGVMFTAAGTLAWREGWVLLVVMLAVRTCGALAVHRVNPELLRHRVRLPVHRDQSWTDRVLVAAILAAGFIGVPLLAAADVFRWAAWPRSGALLGVAGLLMFASGWALKSMALYANAFATGSVRLQRAQTVVASGVYGVVRHPFYAADPLIMIGLSLWLGSLLAAILALVPITLVIVRLLLEERLLVRQLPGYREYAQRVAYRLVPGVW